VWQSGLNNCGGVVLCSKKYNSGDKDFKMKTDFQSVLSAVLREQQQCSVQHLDALRVGHSTSAAIVPPAKGNSPLKQLSDIESFLVDVENPTYFKISLLCAAPKISEKEKAMVLATNLITDDFS
jgi:hypothetical protein